MDKATDANPFREALHAGLLFLDGGMGTQLQARGLAPGEEPETWNLARAADVTAVHAAYVAAGSDTVYTNTFGANGAKYHGAAPLEDVVAAAVANARAAAPRFVALDVGPTGRLLRPAGDFSFAAAYDAFAVQIAAGARAGADLVAIETMGDAYELKAAVLAARENADLPVIATVALGADGKLLTGADPETVAALLEGLRVDALGFNCGLGPDRMLPYLVRLAAATRLPIVAKPNAGLPVLRDGKTCFETGPEAFAEDVAALVAAGAVVVGGCCGTTPAHLAAVKARLAGVTPPPRELPPPRCVVTSGSRCVEIPFDDTIVIGERINPTGKKKLKQALTDGDVAYVLREAVAQAEAGAHVLDVNTGVPGIDETAVLGDVIEAVQGVTDLPLQIDTSSPAALARALRLYNGKPLVNSVNGTRESLDAVLPLVARYGGAVVALTLDENGIPPTAEGRLAIARKILARGAEHGLGPDDFLVDVLCLATSADATSATVILETLRRVKAELGCRTCLGVSNISFGLPARPALNAAFYTAALAAGLSAGIVNPLAPEMMGAYRAWRALAGRDAQCAAWIAAAAQQPAQPVATAASDGPDLAAAIRRGLREDAGAAARVALAAGVAPLDLVKTAIVPALETVGTGFEKGTVFLPQLLMAADAAGAAFDAVREALARAPQTAAADDTPPIVFATVKGDIHDIGKNICRALLENYGFKVADLGRDVPPEKVLEAVRRTGARVVGLSALMTTTVGYMEETIRLVHAECPGTVVIVGGAVLTPDFAARIGADAYSKDAMEMVRLCTRYLKG